MSAPQDNWLDAQLEEAKREYQTWPQWMKDCSRSGEYIRSKKASKDTSEFAEERKLLTA